MRKIIAVGGRPGTGKTTLFKKFMEQGNYAFKEPVKLLPSLYNEEKDLYVLGKYEEGETFAGTDRLSMAVQPVVQDWLKTNDSNILFEGDRIFNQSFLEFAMNLPNTELIVLYLKASEEGLKQRYKDRGSDQSEQFLRGRETKYNNILSNFELMSYITEFTNETYEDQQKIIEFLNEKF